jgi:hypothetical protein
MFRARVLGGGVAWFALGAFFAAAPWRGVSSNALNVSGAALVFLGDSVEEMAEGGYPGGYRLHAVLGLSPYGAGEGGNPVFTRKTAQSRRPSPTNPPLTPSRPPLTRRNRKPRHIGPTRPQGKSAQVCIAGFEAAATAKKSRGSSLDPGGGLIPRQQRRRIGRNCTVKE